MEGDLIKINEWLSPLSWLYGLGVRFRNQLFDWGVLKSRSFDIPVISVGNITVGGTGKTPHTEYIVRLLQDKCKVAVLSRGYKRKSSGFVLAGRDVPMEQIGDEPFQMYRKFPSIYVAVDRDRCHGIDRLCDGKTAPGTEAVILDDAFQHRYVTPGLNILLVDYHRLICDDKLLPAGRLREPQEGKYRAHVVIVTKCPSDIKPMGFRVIRKALNLYPCQELYFSTFRYRQMIPVFGNGKKRLLDTLRPDEQVMLLTGIASPEQMQLDLGTYTSNLHPMPFKDHHYFTADDVRQINERFSAMALPKLIVTTEKDMARLQHLKGLSEEVKKALYALPVEVEFLQGRQNMFNENIISYVFKNSRNGILAESKNVDSAGNSNHSRHRSGKTGSRNH